MATGELATVKPEVITVLNVH